MHLCLIYSVTRKVQVYRIRLSSVFSKVIVIHNTHFSGTRMSSNLGLDCF